MERQQQIQTWLAALFPGRDFSLAPASADASFRRYFRVTFADGATRVVMDAPPANEDCRPWLHVQQLFEAAGAHVPQVIAQDLERGFLLLSDLGNATYLQALDADNAVPLYADAIATLVSDPARQPRPACCPTTIETLLRRELDLFPQWYLARTPWGSRSPMAKVRGWKMRLRAASWRPIWPNRKCLFIAITIRAT
jgi:aminoglycoside/choline kinase family phosphotransferase